MPTKYRTRHPTSASGSLLNSNQNRNFNKMPDLARKPRNLATMGSNRHTHQSVSISKKLKEPSKLDLTCCLTVLQPTGSPWAMKTTKLIFQPPSTTRIWIFKVYRIKRIRCWIMTSQIWLEPSVQSITWILGTQTSSTSVRIRDKGSASILAQKGSVLTSWLTANLKTLKDQIKPMLRHLKAQESKSPWWVISRLK